MPRPLKLSAMLALLASSVFIRIPAPAAEPKDWSKDAAAQYLDERCDTWFAFSRADHGEDATKTSCVCCHTIVPYALSRPALRKLTGAAAPTDQEKKLLAQTKIRIEGWANLDTPAYRLLYDANEQKKKESRGTEAILNALMLASCDRYAGRSSPEDITKKAFAILWREQLADGANKGAWEWFNFGLQPWESTDARYYGAALAAIAVGTAPGYYSPGKDAQLDGKIALLRGFLKQNLTSQNLYNKAWALWAGTTLDGILTLEDRKAIVTRLLAKQRADGGWSLASLGDYKRIDGSAQETASDGYATGLVLQALQVAGIPRDEANVAADSPG